MASEGNLPFLMGSWNRKMRLGKNEGNLNKRWVTVDEWAAVPRVTKNWTRHTLPPIILQWRPMSSLLSVLGKGGKSLGLSEVRGSA